MMKPLKSYIGTVHFKSFLAGIGAVLLLVFILGLFVGNDYQWQINKDNKYMLRVTGFDRDGGLIEIEIERNPETNFFNSCKFMIQSVKRPIVAFNYKAKGKYNSPEFFYGSVPDDGRMAWCDLNFDSRFDKRLVFSEGSPRIEINVDGHWIDGKGDKGIDGKGDKEFKTSEGIFIFDSNSGNWTEKID